MSRAKPFIFGEVLFDIYPEGNSRLGGAPFNVAWHLQALGLDPVVITRVGRDRLGDEIVHAMRDWGMETSGVQRDPLHPTGTVRVVGSPGRPEFQIPAQQAYDFIDAAEASRIMGNAHPGLVYSGTLAQRHFCSKNALRSLRESSSVPRIVDLNLRKPWWNLVAVREELTRAHWLKVNREELDLVSEEKAGTVDEALAALKKVQAAYEIEMAAVTWGEEGAGMVSSLDVLFERPPEKIKVVDTVGAGDAFSAIMAAGLLGNWDVKTTLRRSLTLAGRICSIRGPVPKHRDFYRDFLKWMD